MCPKAAADPTTRICSEPHPTSPLQSAAAIGAAAVSAGFPVGGRLPIKGTMPAADNPSGLATAAFASRAGRAPTYARLVSGRRQRLGSSSSVVWTSVPLDGSEVTQDAKQAEPDASETGTSSEVEREEFPKRRPQNTNHGGRAGEQNQSGGATNCRSAPCARSRPRAAPTDTPAIDAAGTMRGGKTACYRFSIGA